MSDLQNMVRRLQVTGWANGSEFVTVDRGGFATLIEAIAKLERFDEDFYLSAYPDVAQGIENGDFPDAHSHYVNFGFLEGRCASLVGFDAVQYANKNPDVAELYGYENAAALVEHYVQHGCKEGRPIA